MSWGVMTSMKRAACLSSHQTINFLFFKTGGRLRVYYVGPAMFGILG